MTDNLLNKNTTLPKNVSDILYSEYQHVLLYKMQNLHKLIDIDIPLIEEAVKALYNNELTLAEFNKHLQNIIKTPNVDINSLARDIVGLRLLIASDYFSEQGQDIKKYLETSGGISEKYLKNLETFKKALAEEAAGTYDHSAYLYDDEEEKPKIILDDEDEEIESKIIEDNLSQEERISRLKNFFEMGLSNALELDDKEGDGLLEDINDELVLFLTDSLGLQKELTKILATNQLLIGQANIIIEEKQFPPTGENWLKDFFYVIGSDNFDSLNIAKYIITSANAKKLTEAEQAKLRRFLILYHNLKYFPAPFTAIPIDNWEIMPGSIGAANLDSHSIPRSINELNKGNNLASVPAPTPMFKKIEVRAPNVPIKNIEKNSLISPAAEIKTVAPLTVTKEAAKPVAEPAPAPNFSSELESESPEITELKNMLLQYPQGSLERAAVEEEIKKLQNK